MVIKNAKFVTSVADAKSLYNTETSEIQPVKWDKGKKN